jgi:XisI protein
MVTVRDYSAIIKGVIETYARFKPSYGTIEAETVFDDERGHYELIYTGWVDQKRVHGSVVHVDLKGDKVWIQHDGTERGIVDDLLEQGIPPTQIVLGFQHETQRKHGEFALM